eukprot:Tamp_03516.p2 GENE.Tamp_03516~~Tamp_03516.p2  ORF type:complete len:379 (+),score=50.05 Tamp_03516:2430-3566(+)
MKVMQQSEDGTTFESVDYAAIVKMRKIMPLNATVVSQALLGDYLKTRRDGGGADSGSESDGDDDENEGDDENGVDRESQIDQEEQDWWAMEEHELRARSVGELREGCNQLNILGCASRERMVNRILRTRSLKSLVTLSVGELETLIKQQNVVPTLVGRSRTQRKSELITQLLDLNHPEVREDQAGSVSVLPDESHEYESHEYEGRYNSDVQGGDGLDVDMDDDEKDGAALNTRDPVRDASHGTGADVGDMWQTDIDRMVSLMKTVLTLNPPLSSAPGVDEGNRRCVLCRTEGAKNSGIFSNRQWAVGWYARQCRNCIVTRCKEEEKRRSAAKVAKQEEQATELRILRDALKKSKAEIDMLKNQLSVAQSAACAAHRGP